MARLQLSSAARTDFRKSNTKKIRREGGIPATIYGHGDESQAVSVVAEELAEILKTPGARLSLIELKIDSKSDASHPVMIKAVQRDPLVKNIIHIDFQRVKMDEVVHASVPVVIHGEAPGAKLGGMLETVASEVEVKCLPDCVPTHFDVDISGLEIGMSIHARDLDIPAGVEITNPTPEGIIVTVRPQHARSGPAEEAPAAAAGEAPTA